MKKILFFLTLSFSVFSQERMEFPILTTLSKTDTLYVHSTPDEMQYFFIYKGDTLASEWTFGTLGNAFSSLGALGFSNTFLLSTYAGDGCPILYRIVVVRDNGTWFASELFGNCNWLSDFKIKGGRFLEWNFPAMAEAKRRKLKVVFDTKLFILK